MRNEEGFILKKVDYSETSAILTLFTKGCGLKTFYFPGAKKKKSAYLRPLAEIQFSYKEKADSEQMPLLSNAEELSLWQAIYADPLKSTQLFFINEMLYQSLVDSDIDTNLYAFIKHSLTDFDSENKTANFHLYFICQLTRYLGFFPDTSIKGSFFDLYQGRFDSKNPGNNFFEEGDCVNILQYLFEADEKNYSDIRLSGEQRYKTAELLVKYYQTQLDGFRPPKSLNVLEVVFK